MNTHNEKVMKVLQLQAQGVDIEGIAKQTGYADVKSLKRAMNKNGFSCKKDIFTPKESAKPVENTEFNAIELHMAKLVKSMNEIQELVKLEANKKELRIEPRELNLKQTSIRIDAEVAEQFDQFCEKYGNVQKSYLYTLALEEFMKKYI